MLKDICSIYVQFSIINYLKELRMHTDNRYLVFIFLGCILPCVTINILFCVINFVFSTLGVSIGWTWINHFCKFIINFLSYVLQDFTVKSANWTKQRCCMVHTSTKVLLVLEMYTVIKVNIMITASPNRISVTLV